MNNGRNQNRLAGLLAAACLLLGCEKSVHPNYAVTGLWPADVTPEGGASMDPSQCELSMRLVMDRGWRTYSNGAFAYSDPVCIKKKGDIIRAPDSRQIVLNVSGDLEGRICVDGTQTEEPRKDVHPEHAHQVRCQWDGWWVAGWPFSIELTTLAYEGTNGDMRLTQNRKGLAPGEKPARVKEIVAGVDAAVNGVLFNIWRGSEEQATARASMRRYNQFNNASKHAVGGSDFALDRAVSEGYMVVIPGVKISGSNNKQPMGSEVSLRFTPTENPGDVAPAGPPDQRITGLAARALWKTIEALSKDANSARAYEIAYCALAENSDPPTDLISPVTGLAKDADASAKFPRGQPRFVYAYDGERTKMSRLERLSIDGNSKVDADPAPLDCSIGRNQIEAAKKALDDARELFKARTPTAIVNSLQKLAGYETNARQTVEIIKGAYKLASSEIDSVARASGEERAEAAYDLAVKVARPVEEIFPPKRPNPASKAGQAHLDAKLEDRWQTFVLGLWHAVPVQFSQAGGEQVKFEVREDSLIPSVLLYGLRGNRRDSVPSIMGALGLTGTRETVVVDQPSCRQKGADYPGDEACTKTTKFRAIPHVSLWVGSFSVGYGLVIDGWKRTFDGDHHRLMLGVDLVRLISGSSLATSKGGTSDNEN